MSEQLSALSAEHPPRTTAELVLERLKDDVLTGHLPPGTKLTERELTERYQASRTPVREALKQLVSSQLAVNVPYHGVYVRQVSFEFARDIYEVRAGLEGLAGSLAAQRAGRVEIERLEAIYGEIDALSERAMDRQELRDEIMRLNTKFHSTIARSAHNPVLLKKIDELWISVNLVRFTVWQTVDRIESSRIEHLEILETIKAGDHKRAQELCFQHSFNAWGHVAGVLGAGGRPGQPLV